MPRSDGLHIKIQREMAQQIVSSPTRVIFNSTFEIGEITMGWRDANIMKFFKKEAMGSEGIKSGLGGRQDPRDNQ